jgi:hypothetical protein
MEMEDVGVIYQLFSLLNQLKYSFVIFLYFHHNEGKSNCLYTSSAVVMFCDETSIDG